MAGKTKLEEKMDTRTRKDPVLPRVMDGGGPVLPTRVAVECNRDFEQELTKEEEGVHVHLAGTAKDREWDAWKQHKLRRPVEFSAQAEDITWKAGRWHGRGYNRGI